jgi:hypothetical protein
MNGEGEYKWEDGKIYKGEYVDDKRHGHGRLSWPDGRFYDG